MKTDFIEGEAWGTYVALARSAPPERGIAYRTRVPGLRSPRRRRRWRKSTTRRRGTGRRDMNGGRVREAPRPEPRCIPSTGERIDIERVTSRSEGGRGKSTRWGTSLAVYSTLVRIWRGAETGNRSAYSTTALCAGTSGAHPPASPAPPASGHGSSRAPRAAPPERPAQRDFRWCWIGVSGWSRVAPQGCPGGTAAGRATEKAGGGYSGPAPLGD
jgi:hypothetical protein